MAIFDKMLNAMRLNSDDDDDDFYNDDYLEDEDEYEEMCIRDRIYLMVLGLLISVLLFGEEVNGATRWISVAGIQFQPSELCKILLICFFAAFLTKYRDYLDRWKMLGVCLILAAFPLLLIFKQPNLSTTIIVALIFITLLFIAGLSYKIIVTILAAGIPGSVVTLRCV